MWKWREVYRCIACGKIYKDSVPDICGKCGERLRTYCFFGMASPDKDGKCEKVIARRRLFGWEVKEPKEKESDTPKEE